MRTFTGVERERAWVNQTRFKHFQKALQAEGWNRKQARSIARTGMLAHNRLDRRGLRLLDQNS